MDKKSAISPLKLDLIKKTYGVKNKIRYNTIMNYVEVSSTLKDPPHVDRRKRFCF